LLIRQEQYDCEVEYQEAFTKLKDSLLYMYSQLNKNSLNYCANVEGFFMQGIAGQRVNEIIAASLGEHALLGGTYSLGVNEIQEMIISTIDDGGDRGSHPNLDYINSQDYVETKAAIVNLLGQVLSVFWDYAYLFEKEGNTYVLIGSCSD
jgi:hypothetical protein